MAQRGVARAEIVEGDPAAHTAQRVDKTGQFLNVIQGSGFGDFHDKTAREIGAVP